MALFWRVFPKIIQSARLMVILMPTMVVKEEDGNVNGGEIGRL